MCTWCFMCVQCTQCDACLGSLMRGVHGVMGGLAGDKMLLLFDGCVKTVLVSVEKHKGDSSFLFLFL